jgi:prepilin-type N-terminal cleavage/methylation domain-containing protein
MNKSFTLIEILVVIVVIGVLSAFILVGMGSITGSANIAKGKVFVNSMDNSLLLARVSQWKMDEGVNVTLNDSWGTNTGSLVNFNFNSTDGWRTGSQCVSGFCLELDGSDDFINLGVAFGDLGLSDFTISLWFVAPKDGAYKAFIAKGVVNANDFLLYKLYSGGDIIRLYCDGGGLDMSTDLWNADKWNNITITREGALAKMYVNGVYITQDTTAAVDITNPHNWNLGGSEDGTARLLDGFLDEVKVYNKALSISTIEGYYFLGINNLFKNKGINLDEFNQRLVELKSNMVNNE